MTRRMTRTARPDFLLIGAPKAGTTALHAALAAASRGVRDRPEGAEVLALRRRPPAGTGAAPATGTPSRSGSGAARTTPTVRAGAPATRCAARARRSTCGAAAPTAGSPSALPDVKLIAVVRDPIDRAYSNWMHLWSDGLEPVPTSRRRSPCEDERIAPGWAPFWRYRDLGLYGEQLRAPLPATSTRSGSSSCATATSSTTRARPSTAPAGSSASREGLVGRDPARQLAPLRRARAGDRRVLGPVVRAGACGRASSRRREVWRTASAAAGRSARRRQRARTVRRLTAAQRARGCCRRSPRTSRCSPD